MVRCAIYIMSISVTLGSSLWVLYTSNNLISLATIASLHARDLEGIQVRSPSPLPARGVCRLAAPGA